MYAINNQFQFVTGGREVEPVRDIELVHQFVATWLPCETARRHGRPSSNEIVKFQIVDHFLRGWFPTWLEYMDEVVLAGLLRKHPPIKSPASLIAIYNEEQSDHAYRSEIVYVINKMSQRVQPSWTTLEPRQIDIVRQRLDRIAMTSGLAGYQVLEGPLTRPLKFLMERIWNGMSDSEVLAGLNLVQPGLVECIARIRSQYPSKSV